MHCLLGKIELTYGSLFSGIGGFDLGLDRAGWHCRWQIEIDEYCRRVLEKHWPGVKRYGDIAAIRGEDLEPVELIAGGFPCQDVSQAGRRRGLFDADGAPTRSGLWLEFARIVREVRPRFVVAENTPGLLTLDGVMARVVGDLAGCGPAIPAGPTSSESARTSRRRLNPRFVEWLMGFPVTWSEL